MSGFIVPTSCAAEVTECNDTFGSDYGPAILIAAVLIVTIVIVVLIRRARR